jgi:hypothetical protein
MGNSAYTVASSAAALDVDFGPERYVYERLLFGSSVTKGIPAGDFYDMRGYPVPYTPYTVTDISLTLPKDSNLVGRQIKLEIIRDSPQKYPAFEVLTFVPCSENTSFGVKLDRGLNYLKLTTATGDTVGSFALSASRFATVLYSIAVDIYSKLWEPIDSTSREIFNTYSGLFTNTVKFNDLLPQTNSRHLLSIYLTMRALVPKAGTEEGLKLLTQAILDQTPVFRDISENDWSTPWLRPDPPTTLSQVGREIHLWSYDDTATQITQFGRICKNIGSIVTSHDKYGATVDGLRYDWRHYLDSTTRSSSLKQLPRYDGHVTSIETSLDMKFPWTEGRRTVVQFPGLWDGNLPYLDQGVLYDQGLLFDKADTEGPLGYKGWVGVPVMPAPMFSEAASEGRPNMSVLIATETTSEIQNSLSYKSLTMTSVMDWSSSTAFAVNATSLSTLTSADWTDTPENITADATVDNLAVISVTLTETSQVSHNHTIRLITVGEWKAILSGTTLTINSNLNADGDHYHVITISYSRSRIVISIGSNHGHLATTLIPAGLGL